MCYKNKRKLIKMNHCERCMNKCLKHWFRRCFLPFTIILFFIPFDPFKKLLNYVYFPFISGGASFIIYWNFPILAYVTASRPLYYEDLFIDEKKLPNYNIDTIVKEKYQCIFQWVLIVTNSILFGLLSDFWLYKTSNENTFLQIVGITGGIIKIFQMVNNIIGRILLKIIKREISGENIRFEKEQQNSIENIVNLKKVHNVSDILNIELTTMNKNIILKKNNNFMV
jgi:hypothetical protein